jgi:hypothetical protein
MRFNFRNVSLNADTGITVTSPLLHMCVYYEHSLIYTYMHKVSVSVRFNTVIAESQVTRLNIWNIRRSVDTCFMPRTCECSLNRWLSGLCPSSGILNTRNHNVSETGSVSVLRWGPWKELTSATRLCTVQNSGRWTKSRKPFIPRAVHQRQKPQASLYIPADLLCFRAPFQFYKHWHIRHADHVAPSIRTSWQSLRRQAAVARSV